MKTYKVRIKKAPMKMGGYSRYQDGGQIPGEDEFDYGMMTDTAGPVQGSLEGSVTLAPTDADYALPLMSSPAVGPTNVVPPSYKGVSVYDFLASQGKKADYASRKELAKSMGIKNYTGRADQNIAMLAMLQGDTSINPADLETKRPSSAGLPNGRSSRSNQQRSNNQQAQETAASTEDYRAWDADGNYRWPGDTHPRFDQLLGANYHPAYDSRHQPWSPNTGLTEEQHQELDKNYYYNKPSKKPVKHSALNDLTNALTGARSYDEYSKKNPYFFNFLGVNDKSSTLVKALDALPHHFEDAVAKVVYDGDPLAALELGALIASRGLKGKGSVKLPKQPKGLPGTPPPKGLPSPPPSGGFTMPGRGVGNYTYGPPKGGFTMPGRGGLGNFTYYEDGGEMDEMAYGGQIGYGLDLNSRRVYTDMPNGKQDSVGRTLGPVDPSEATYEAEKGEVIVGDFDKDGNQETMTFGGKPHSKGGTPAKEQGFIYSKTKNMALGGPIISEFGKTPGKKYTPADLAKQYDLTKYKAVLDDPNADPLAKRTAELMTEAYKKKLGKLAFVQESVKGFPQGVPQIAAEAYPELAEKIMGQKEAEGQEMPNEEEEMARYGGYYQNGGNTTRYPVMDPEYLKYLSGLNSGRIQVGMSPNASDKDPNRFTLPGLQDRNASGVYGEEDWWSGENQADFKKRHAWFLDDAPGWDPRTPGATKAFQEAYNARMKAFGNKPYFGGKNKFTAADDMFGEYTFSAPGFEKINVPVEGITPRTIVPGKTNIPIPEIKWKPTGSDIPKDDTIPGKRKKGNLPYNRFDVANLMMAAATPVKSYAPRMYLPDMQEVQGYYDQPDYNAMLSAAATRGQMNNAFSNASAAMAANSYVPDLTQGILQETQRARANNLQTANQISQANTGIRNQSNVVNAQLMQDNYDKWVKTQEETDIANKLKWRKDVMPAAQNMVNNRINMQRLNMMYPEYAMTGPYWNEAEFQRGYGLGDNPSTSGYGNITFDQYLASNPQLKEIYSKSGDKDDSKLKIHQMYQQYIAQRANMYGKSSKNLSANAISPYVAQMMGMPVGGIDPEDYYPQ